MGSVAAASGLTLSRPSAGLFDGLTSQAPLGFHNAPNHGIGPEHLKLVSGRAPDGLSGVLYRNGPAHFRRGGQVLDHWFDGDGLVRSFSINGNQAVLQARFAKTIKRKRDAEAGRFIMPGFGTSADKTAPVGSPDDANAANTSVLCVGDKLWALWEAGSPYALDPDDLSTIGPVTLRDDLAQMPFSAHPKIDQDGIIWNFGMAYGSPLTFVWALAPSGKVLKTGMLNLPIASYMHDWVVSDTKLIVPLQPWVFTKRHPPFVKSLTWQPEHGLKVLVVDKNDFSNTQLYELPPGAFFHTGKAVEESDGTLRFDICLADAPTLDADIGSAILRGVPIDRPNTHLKQAILRPNGRAEIVSTGLAAEFPQSDAGADNAGMGRVFFVSEGKEVNGKAYRYNAVAAFNWATETSDIFSFGRDVLVEEPIFVSDPKHSRSGHLLVPALNLSEGATYLHLFDADNVASGPTASWRSRYALPLSFHGTWRARP